MVLQMNAATLLVPITTSATLVLAALLAYIMLWQSARQKGAERATAALISD